MQAKFEAQVAADTVNVLEDFDLAESDREQLARPETMQIMRESIGEHAVNGVYGWSDDVLALARDWGFDLSEITVPVLIRYGTADVLVPPSHGEWLAAHVPGCVVKVDDTGHSGATRSKRSPRACAGSATGSRPPSSVLRPGERTSRQRPSRRSPARRRRDQP